MHSETMHSETIGQIALALSKAQGQITGAKKDGKSNRNRYATLSSVQDAIRGPLADYELSYFQATQIEDSAEILFTMLVHSSGEWYRTENVIPPSQGNKGMSDIQSYGSTLTYLKRYQLSALVGVSASDDDNDGEKPLSCTNETPKITPKDKIEFSPTWLLNRVNASLKRDKLPEYSGLENLYAVLKEWPKTDDGWVEAGQRAIEYKCLSPQLDAMVAELDGYDTRMQVWDALQILEIKLTPEADIEWIYQQLTALADQQAEVENAVAFNEEMKEGE